MEHIDISTLGGLSHNHESRVADLEVAGIDGQGELTLRSVHTRDKLPMMMDSSRTTADADLWPHLRGFSIPQARAEQVMLLIGQDNAEAHASLSTIFGWRNEPYAVKTCLDWTLHGVLKDTQDDRPAHAYLITTLDSNSLHQDMCKLWQLVIGDAYSETKTMSIMDKRVVSL